MDMQTFFVVISYSNPPIYLITIVFVCFFHLLWPFIIPEENCWLGPKFTLNIAGNFEHELFHILVSVCFFRSFFGHESLDQLNHVSSLKSHI